MDHLYVQSLELFQKELRQEIKSCESQMASSRELIELNVKQRSIAQKRLEQSEKELAEYRKQNSQEKCFVPDFLKGGVVEDKAFKSAVKSIRSSIIESIEKEETLGFDAFLKQCNKVRKLMEEKAAYERVCEAVRIKIAKLNFAIFNKEGLFENKEGAKILLGTKAYQAVMENTCNASTKTLFSVPFAEIVEDTENIYLVTK